MVDTNIAKETREMPRHRPATDIVEMEDGFHIMLDMPGVSKENLIIDLNENEIMVSGVTTYAADPSVDSKAKYAHMEFGGGEYRRAFTLSDDVDKDKITAKLENGVLDLHLPKSEKKEPKRITITQA